jgi:glycosyltransferase involved in cell wall biosynthesis
MFMTHTRSGMPLVAIVTPVYNGEEYLAETMDCVQSLDYENLVHIVLDNASTDATAAIISNYRNSRVPLLTSRNNTTIPMVSNLNAAVKMVPAEAGYFRLLCADDTMTADAISKQVNVAVRDPDIGIVGCECHDALLPQRDNKLLSPRNQNIFDGKEVIRGFLGAEHHALAGTQVLIRRSKLDEQPLFYDPALGGAADTDANLRVCVDNKFGFVHEKLATWRRHQQSYFSKFSLSYFDKPARLMLLDRYGPLVWKDSEYRAHRTSYRRHYLRRLLLLRWQQGGKTTFNQHMTILRQNNEPAGWLDFVDASAEWAFRFLTRQRAHPE